MELIYFLFLRDQYCLMSLKTIVLYVLSVFGFVVSGGRMNLVSGVLSWPKAEVSFNSILKSILSNVHNLGLQFG